MHCMMLQSSILLNRQKLDLIWWEALSRRRSIFMFKGEVWNEDRILIKIICIIKSSRFDPTGLPTANLEGWIMDLWQEKDSALAIAGTNKGFRRHPSPKSGGQPPKVFHPNPYQYFVVLAYLAFMGLCLLGIFATSEASFFAISWMVIVVCTMSIVSHYSDGLDNLELQLGTKGWSSGKHMWPDSLIYRFNFTTYSQLMS